MPTDVTPIEDAKLSYKEGAGNAPARYVRATKRAKFAEKAASDKAQALYVKKVTDPTIQARRQKKLKKVTDEFWRGRCEKRGGAVIGTRMGESVDLWATNTKPYLEAQAAVDKPDKTGDPVQDAKNIVGAYVEAVVKKKKELLGEE